GRHLYRAAAHREQAIAGIALGENRRALRDLLHFRVSRDAVADLGLELAKYRMAAQQRAFFRIRQSSFGIETHVTHRNRTAADQLVLEVNTKFGFALLYLVASGRGRVR